MIKKYIQRKKLTLWHIGFVSWLVNSAIAALLNELLQDIRGSVKRVMQKYAGTYPSNTHYYFENEEYINKLTTRLTSSQGCCGTTENSETSHVRYGINCGL